MARRLDCRTNHEICNRQMNEEQVHLILHFPLYPLLQELLEGDRVEGETNEEEDGVDGDGDDLGLAKHHVCWGTEVPGDINLPLT